MSAKKKGAKKTVKGTRKAATSTRVPANIGAAHTVIHRICKKCGMGTADADRCRACGTPLGKK